MTAATKPIEWAEPVTTSDTTDLAPFRAVYVGTAGNLAIRQLNGANRTYTNVAAGTWFPVRGDRILSTGTTASGLLVGY